MVNVTYSADQTRLDDPVHEAALERPGKPIRIRIQPTVFRRRERGGGQHRAWLDVSWILECKTREEAIALRDTMRLFFDLVSAEGPVNVARRLAKGLA